MKDHPFIRDKIFISYRISLFLHIPSLFFVHFCLLIKSVEWLADHVHVVRDPLINGGALSICLNEVDAFLYDIPSADTAGRRITRAACQAALFLHAADVTHRWIVQDVSHGEKELALNGTLNGYSSVFWRVCWELLSSPTCRFALTLTHPLPPSWFGNGKTPSTLSFDFCHSSSSLFCLYHPFSHLWLSPPSSSFVFNPPSPPLRLLPIYCRKCENL